MQPTEILITCTNVKLNPKAASSTFTFDAPPEKAQLVRDETEYLATTFQRIIQSREDMKRAQQEAGSDPLAPTPPPKEESNAGPGAAKPPAVQNESNTGPALPSTSRSEANTRGKGFVSALF